MLDDGEHTARDEPLRRGPAADRDLLGLRAIGAIRDHRIGAGNGNVEHGEAVDRDAERSKLMRDEARAKPYRCPTQQRVADPREARGRGVSRPKRRPEPLHPPAFLIDEHRRVVAPNGFAKFTDEAL